MSKAKDNALKTYDYELLFKDSPEYFYVPNAKMLQEGKFVRFLMVENNDISSEVWFPISNIHRIKRNHKV